MKVVSARQMAELEAIAYQNGCQEIDFMEQAGLGIARIVQKHVEDYSLACSVLLLCGKGNNAGDAFVAGCYLMEEGYQVCAIQPDPLEICSPLCRLNRVRFEKKGGKVFSSFSACPNFSLILDGIFGTGFKGTVKEPYAALIETANQARVPIFAIDIPSGLDGNTGQIGNCAIQATQTIYLGLPKIGFFLRDGWNIVGHLQKVDFGLPSSIIETASFQFELLTAEKMAGLLPSIQRCRHKYQAGYVAGLGGSLSMPGASILAALAALRGGAGMVKLLHVQGMEAVLANSPYELIKLPYDYHKPEEVIAEMQKAGATFVGPGLGRTAEVKQLLREVIPKLEKPCVIDADALILLAENHFKLPKYAILTPHTGEMQKLLHLPSHLTLDENLMQTCQEYAANNAVTLVLKGAPTFIFHPGSPVLINPTGDPGMATAGSGDVLTGLLASLLAQGLSCQEAAALGVYLHGLAGEYAANAYTSYGVIASDLIAHFPQAYHFLSFLKSKK